MGTSYTFNGHLEITPAPDELTVNFVNNLSRTRRMKRNPQILKKMGFNGDYGVDGEFFYNPKDLDQYGQTEDESIIDYNTPPRTQPSLWMDWSIKGNNLVWNGAEKSRNPAQWFTYLIEKIFKPRGYTLNGTVTYELGTIEVINNQVQTTSNFVF